ncbi:MAG: UDP-N-acetylmuramoyl-tripeptide--D-alanyl-D-alanine ligase [Bacteroidota bacterium]
MNSIESLYPYFLQYPNVITDSRKIEPNCLFFALKGPNFNGNQYAKEALEKGAAYAIIDEVADQLDDRHLLVEDVLTTLQQLARYHRQQMEIPVLAITGSNGKTTTKALISEVMSSHYRTHFTKGNFNNHIGVPLTLLAMPQDTEVAIIEMGANHQGEIALLCSIAQPTHGLITNIGKAHLEGFGGLEGVKKGKGELYDYLAKVGGLAFVNLDEAHLADLSEKVTHRIFYLKSETLDPAIHHLETVMLEDRPVLSAAFLNENEELVKLQSHLMGEYNFQNIMSAIAIGRYFKVPGGKIKAAIEGYIPQNNRSQMVRQGDNTYLLDAYNANPTSMINALNYFAGIETDAKIAILGDMLELGEYSQQEHQAILDHALNLAIQTIVLVGKAFQQLETQHLPQVYQFEHAEATNHWLAEQHFENHHFLIKGSRGIALERILEKG